MFSVRDRLRHAYEEEVLVHLLLRSGTLRHCRIIEVGASSCIVKRGVGVREAVKRRQQRKRVRVGKASSGLPTNERPFDMDPLTTFCPNMDCPARGHTARGNIKIHCHKRRRYRCSECRRTFSQRTGTPFLNVKTDPSLIVIVVTLIAYGCPVRAIEAAFGIQRRTVRGWIQKAGAHARTIHEAIVVQPQVLQHVQTDEIFVRRQGPERSERWLYLFSALCVSTRLWLGGVIAPHRGTTAAQSLASMVRRAALPGALLVVCDGLRGYVTAFQRAFRSPLRTGRPGRPRLLPWPGVAVVQHVKNANQVRLAHGAWDTFVRLFRQVGTRVVSTAYIERLNATFRERLAVLARRTRHLARTQATLEASLYLMGTIYNFCAVHRSLGLRRTPAMAAGLTRTVWTPKRLLWHKVPPERWRPPVHRGPLSARERALLDQWGH
jgi:transposase-like protein